MSGVATLARPPATSAPRPARGAVGVAPRTGALRAALLLATWAGACAAVGSSRDLVTSFGGTVRTLGSLNPYADDAATALAWLLVMGALLCGARAARDAGAAHRARARLLTAAGGAALLALGAGASIWSDKVNGTTHSKGWLADAVKPLPTGHEVHELSRAALGLSAAGWLVLAVAAMATLGATARASRAWRRALTASTVGFALLAVGEAAKLGFYWSAAAAPGGDGRLVVWVPTVLGWLALAVAAALVGVALRAAPRTRRLMVAAPFGVVGALCLSVWSATVLVYAQLELTAAGQSWFVTLSKVEQATEYAGLIALSLAAGVAATRVTSRPVAPR